LKFQQPVLLEVPKFKTALDYRDRFSFGIDKLDSKLQMHLEDVLGIFGQTRYTRALATRLVVRNIIDKVSSYESTSFTTIIFGITISMLPTSL
jgi:hypothetical protein